MADKFATIFPKLAPLLRMIFDSGAADGEIVNASRIARRQLKAGGCDAHDLVRRIENPSASPDQDEIVRAFERGRRTGLAEAQAAARNGFDPDGCEGHSWSAVAKFCAANSHRLENDFERDFCASVAKWSRHSLLSEKQKSVLRRIFINRFDGEMS